MGNNTLPKTLPDCELIQILAEKVSQRHGIDFNFLARLDDFRQRVSGEVRQINELFPEYTPHDEQYHLKHLFNVACTVLGRERLEQMNSAELFVLAVALYGHDWGMAVNEPQKRYIVTGNPLEGAKTEDSCVLPDERHRFIEFARKQQLAIDADGHVKEIPIEIWREYVRQTHASRSAERVRRFFDPIDGGVADAASRVCQGHSKDFEDLENYSLYPADYSMLSETVNLRALAVYLRLVDLLDLAEDRTPYVIWKFVAPRDPRSKMEWAKHRALRPVTCRPYLQGRVIQVDGSTDDHEVYAALEDLRIWCEEQLRGCNDLLARMNDPRHKLDLYHIDWRVAAREFKPILIQFEFDRERMFEILGDEIYQGDPYVFLRELLQNSIDAIRMRREILQRRGVGPGDLGVIRVTVEHGDGSDAIVVWHDDGIGMDEYVVRNYFAVAGKSYYRSADFEREGLKLDPISRFGIGTLSCFMVADRVEIETFKDPYLPPLGEPLRITIPAVRRQFRIEVGVREAAEVGTTVRVFVEGRKLPVDDTDRIVKPLDVTAYLSAVAGFVEFPIVITEGDRRTIVLHPKQDPQAARRRFGEEFQVQQLDLSYPWSEAILPQDLSTAHEILREERYNLDSDLGMPDYEGALTYLVPASDEIDRDSDGDVQATSETSQGQSSARVRAHPDWTCEIREVVGGSRSSSRARAFTVYRDGILLATLSPPEPFIRGARRMVRLAVNLPKSRSPKVDLARMQLLGQTEHWASPILQAHIHFLLEKSLKDLLTLDPTERLYQLGRLVAFHFVTPRQLWEVFPHEHWPVPFLDFGGRLTALEWKEVTTDTICLCPGSLVGFVYDLCLCRWLTGEEYKGPLVQWVGEKCGITRPHPVFRPVYQGESRSVSVNAVLDLWPLRFAQSHRLAAVRFLEPPRVGDVPLAQEVWCPADVRQEPPDIETLCEKIVADPTQVSPFELAMFAKESEPFPVTVPFLHPYERLLLYGPYLNIRHPVAHALLRVAALLELFERRKTFPEDKLGQWKDALRAPLSTAFLYGALGARPDQLPHQLRHLFQLVRASRAFDIGGMTHELTLTAQELVSQPSHLSLRMEDIRPFGQTLE